MKGLAGGVTDQVLEDHGHAGERSVRQPARCLLAGVVEQRVDDGVELGVHLLDAGDGCLDQLGRRHLPGAHQPGLIGCVHPGEVVGH